VNENAFAYIVQARPCPTFGRPVHLRGSPHRLQPGTSPHALRIPPRDGHPALRKLRSGGSRSALVCFRLSPSCPCRPLHTFLSSRPARNYPRFRIRRSSSERRRDFNPPEQRAAQRTLPVRPTPHRRACWSYSSSPSPAGLAYDTSGVSRFSRVEFPDMPEILDCAGSITDSRFTSFMVWPSATQNSVGTPDESDYAVQYPACLCLCQRFACRLAVTHA